MPATTSAKKATRKAPAQATRKPSPASLQAAATAPEAPAKAPLSVITCDMEGRIETFSEGAERIFGYDANEVVGKKRVSLFSPGDVVLGHVPRWLKEASTKGEFETDTVFVRKDGTRFAATIRITPTKRDGVQIGYCGQTRPLDVDPDTVMPKTTLGTRMFKGLVIGRAPFLTASLTTVLLAAAWVTTAPGGSVAYGGTEWLAFGLALLGMAALHLASNIFNDYFDVQSGADPGNNDYFLPFTGGSRAVELGITTPRRQFIAATTWLAVALACGIGLVLMGRTLVLAFGAIGALGGYFYTAPPVRLAARRGLGELFVGLLFGPLATAGAAYAIRGSLVAPADFLIGIPLGLLTTAILWVNEFPDTPADVAAGKVHLVATLGLSKARWGYIALLVGAFGTAVALAVTGIVPMGSLLILAGLLLGIPSAIRVVRDYQSRALAKASAGTIGMQMVSALAAAAGLLWLS